MAHSLKFGMTKISDVEYKIDVSLKPGMRVPVTIYADDKLIEKMQTDRTIDQAVNVTHLPGLKKHMIVLPDGHEGYGFPIGGVAATDFNTGVISPGGVGYDINCLPPETEILTPLGFRTTIGSLAVGKEVVCFDRGQGRYTKIILTLCRKESGLIKIQTKSGLTIRATRDHPILTDSGMRLAGLVSKNCLVATHPFVGVRYESPANLTILDVVNFSPSVAKDLKSRKLLPLEICDQKFPYLMKILAYFMGQGSFDGKKTLFHGTQEGMGQLREDILFLGYIPSKIISQCQLENTNVKTSECAEYSLHVSSWSFRRLLESLGAPMGKKTELDYAVPEWVFNTPQWMKRLFLSAYCGAKMNNPQTVEGLNFRPPFISINKSKRAVESGRNFLKQMWQLFEELGIEACCIREERTKTNENVSLTLQLSAKPEMLSLLWSTVGYSYAPQKQRLALVASSWIGRKLNSLRERDKLAVLIASHNKNGLSIPIAEAYHISSSAEESFPEQDIYRVGSPSTTSGSLPLTRFEEWAAHMLDGDIVWDEVSEVKMEEYSGLVYDITVEDDSHNFAANGFIVSNCGVRLIRTNLSEEKVRPKLRELIKELFHTVPSGLGNVGALTLSNQQLDGVLSDGVKWALNNGYGVQEDIEHCEENGTMKHSDPSKVSGEAKKRGSKSLGTLGSGNHFLEIETVNKVLDGEAAKIFGIGEEGQVCILMHTGSRGLGHQVCSDYLKIIDVAAPNFKIELPDRELACAPAGSREAENYRLAMGSALNYAWTNRQIITHRVRKAFERVMGMSESDLEMKLVYDVAHNICKVEEHHVDPQNPKKKEKVFVHRKGATRAFPKGSEAIPEAYRSTGQPVLIPGSMGTASWVLLGRERSMEASFGSTAHGAGRMMSRGAAIRNYPYEKVKQDLESRGIILEAASKKGVVEEAPGAYKDVDSVVEVSDRVGIGTKVVRLSPLGVVKG